VFDGSGSAKVTVDKAKRQLENSLDLMVMIIILVVFIVAVSGKSDRIKSENSLGSVDISSFQTAKTPVTSISVVQEVPMCFPLQIAADH
jgi:hypothetical protein